MSAEPTVAPIVVSEERVVQMSIKQMVAIVALTVSAIVGVYGAQAGAMGTLREERTEVLKAYVTREELAEIRRQDYQFWDNRIDQVIAEIRKK
jgi:hypothetical protein